jgi:hypothetical protein
LNPTPSALLAAALLLPLGPAFAQTAKPAAGETKTLGGSKTSAGKIMTREELRVCLNREAELKTHREDYEAQKTAVENERADVKKLADETLLLRAPVDAKAAEVQAMNGKVAALSARIEAFNARVAKFKEARPSMAERDEVGREEQAIKLDTEALNAARLPLQASYDQAIAEYNAKAQASDQRVTAWNERNARVVGQGKAAEAERDAWVADCADRRYREDDEKAIRAGK